MVGTPGAIEDLAGRVVYAVAFTHVFSSGLITGQAALFDPLGVDLVAPMAYTVTGGHLGISHIRESLA